MISYVKKTFILFLLLLNLSKSMPSLSKQTIVHYLQTLLSPQIQELALIPFLLRKHLNLLFRHFLESFIWYLNLISQQPFYYVTQIVFYTLSTAFFSPQTQNRKTAYFYLHPIFNHMIRHKNPYPVTIICQITLMMMMMHQKLTTILSLEMETGLIIQKTIIMMNNIIHRFQIIIDMIIQILNLYQARIIV